MRRISLPVFLFLSITALAADWPQWLGPQRDGVWRETGVLQTFPAGGPKVLWRAPVGGGYAGPAVADGKVYVMDRVLPGGVENPKDSFSRKAVEGRERLGKEESPNDLKAAI